MTAKSAADTKRRIPASLRVPLGEADIPSYNRGGIMVTQAPDDTGLSLLAEELTLARGARVLVRGLTFSAKAGELVEVRGPNGSGKTSLLRAIAGFMRPLAGKVVLKGHEDPVLAMHLVGHRNGLKGAASALDHVRYWAGLFGGKATAADEALGRAGLARQASLPARVLSQGQARRLALTRLIIAPRPIWLLDEPTAALDEQGKELVATLLAPHLAAGGIAVVALHEPLRLAPTQTIALG
jgi:heme exporter protein A